VRRPRRVIRALPLARLRLHPQQWGTPAPAPEPAPTPAAAPEPAPPPPRLCTAPPRLRPSRQEEARQEEEVTHERVAQGRARGVHDVR